MGNMVENEINRDGINIPAYQYWNEALHGVARSGAATSFPESKGMSSTWDKQLIFGSEAIPAGLFALLACIIPETPQYLVNIGKRYQAKKILTMTNGREYAVQKLTKLNDKTKKGKEK